MRLISVFIVLTIVGCDSSLDRSSFHDIFDEDESANPDGNDRRHKATREERLWTISMGGCTGHLLAPGYMMTANHCGPRDGASYSSGYALGRGQRGDIRVEDIVESHSRLDYAIMKIDWTGSFPKAQKFPPRIATSPTDISVSTRPNQGDEVFTVGFPGDKSRSWGATYAEGRAKIARGSELVYNIGTINGNSGGAVWRKKDKMLVSLTNAGPNQLGQGAWRGNDKDDARHWNFGAGMWAIYQVSPTLRDIFPNGRNRFTRTDEETAIFVAIGKEKGDNSKLYISIPEGTTSPKIYLNCENTDDDGCDSSTSLEAAGNRGTRAIYSTDRDLAIANLRFVVAVETIENGTAVESFSVDRR